LVDIIKGAEEIKVVAELPGVNKEDLRLNANKDSLTIESIAGERRYHKKIDLPEDRSYYRKVDLQKWDP
jgi:HSP20 family protein